MGNWGYVTPISELRAPTTIITGRMPIVEHPGSYRDRQVYLEDHPS